MVGAVYTVHVPVSAIGACVDGGAASGDGGH